MILRAVAPILALAALAGGLGQAQAQTTPPSAPAFLFEMEKQIAAFERQVPEERRWGPGPLADARLALRKARITLAGHGGGLHRFGTEEEDPRAVLAAAVERLNAPPSALRKGFQERAYLSEIDGSAEPYLLYVPTTCDPRTPTPLLIFLHGYHSDLNVANWRDYMYSPALEALCEREGFILLMPYGRSNTEFMGVGEADVLQALQCVREEYNVHPDRIILSGASMGGSGALSIACHYPDLFAGLILITARVDYYQWMRIRPEDLPPFKQAQVDADYGRLLLENLRPLRVLEFHGQADTEFAAQARRLEELARRAGVACECIEIRDQGHYIWDDSFAHAKFREMLREGRRVQNPERVTHHTFSLKYPGAHWARAEAIAHWGRIARIEGRADEGTVRVTAENLSAVRVAGMPPGLRAGGAASILVNGRANPVAAWSAEGVVLRVGDGAPDDGPLRKTPNLCGPIRQAYERAFVIVYPMAAEAEADRAVAIRLAREWLEYVQAVPRVIGDGDLSDAEAARYNLILCGAPETNAVLRRLAGQLPIRIEPEAYRVGERTFPRKDHGLQFIYPSPINPERCVVVVHGVPWAPQVSRNHKLDFLPDFIVYGRDTADDGTWFPTNRVLCAGYFDGQWRISADSLWFGGSPAPTSP